MNENLDLREILKDCPEGMKLYSSVLGDVIFKGIDMSNEKYPIRVENDVVDTGYTAKGRFVVDYKGTLMGECTLFPSKEQRDWSKFKLPKKVCEFRTFQRVLVRDEDYNKWKADIFSHSDENKNYPYICVGDRYRYCLPYEDNEHLLGTKNNPEE